MSAYGLPENPLDLFDLANEVADALAEKATFANLKIALELMTKLTAAMYTYGSYLATEEAAKYSTFARDLLINAAQAWQRTEEELRHWLLVLADRGIVAWSSRVGGPA